MQFMLIQILKVLKKNYYKDFNPVIRGFVYNALDYFGVKYWPCLKLLAKYKFYKGLWNIYYINRFFFYSLWFQSFIL